MGFLLNIKNYKCFGDSDNWLAWKPITVLVGKNNSGKSTLLEIFSKLVDDNFHASQEKHHIAKNGAKSQPSIEVESVLEEKFLKRYFQEGTSGGVISGNHWQYARRFVGHKFRYRFVGAVKEITDIQKINTSNTNGDLRSFGSWKTFEERMMRELKSPLLNRKFHWVIPERHIKSESKHDHPSIEGNGTGLTNAIQTFLNHRNFPSKIVDSEIMKALNEIFYPDHNFTKITVKHLESEYEVHLEEDARESVALSNYGTGVKTVLLILGILHLQPFIEKLPIENYIFAFEELENNLHPQLLRRLLDYLKRMQDEKKFTLILTTHSNVMIDFFSTIKDAQILHIKKDDEQSKISRVETFLENKNILTDLDVRPSDILQANGVIWVEGPSDRIYLNRWIEAWSKGKYKEDTHYQIMFYGGRILSHFTANPSDSTKLLKMLKINMNCFIIIDSDRKNKEDTLNQTKNRIQAEFSSIDAGVWVTNGKEIENYIPDEVITKYLKKPFKQKNKYKSLFDQIEKSYKGEGSSLSNAKTKFAEDVLSDFVMTSWEKSPELNKQMGLLLNEIKKWNSDI